MAVVITFFLTTWLMIISAVGGAAGHYLCANWGALSPQRKLSGLLIIVLVLHVLEEWVYPAGFHYIYNFVNGSNELARYPMNRLSDSLTNFIAVVISSIALFRWSDRPETLLTTALFSLLEVCVHVSFTVVSYRELHTLGMTIPYAPGVVTALFGWLPLAIANLMLLTRRRMFTAKVIVSSLFWLFVLLIVLIVIPETGFRDKNSPYGFLSQGYYDRFVGAGHPLHNP